MDYTDAIEAAGAEVLAYERFGSYQGDWWAKVDYEGKTFWVAGSYGSCSGCDQMEAMESDHHPWNDLPHPEGHIPDENGYSCSKSEPRWAELGKAILSNPYTQAEAEAETAEQPDEWDHEERQRVRAFLASNAIREGN